MRICEVKDPIKTISYSRVGTYVYYLLMIQSYYVLTYLCIFSILILYSQIKFDSAKQMNENLELDILGVLKAALYLLNFFNDVIILAQSYEWALCIYMIKARYRNLSFILQFMNNAETRFQYKPGAKRIRQGYIFIVTVFFVILISRYWIPFFYNSIPTVVNYAMRSLEIIFYSVLGVTLLY